MTEELPYSAMISHSARDAATASQLCSALETRGLSCWIAPRNIPIGADWRDEIMRGIERSAAMILLVSKDSNMSDHVLREVEQAVRHQRPIFPLFLEEVRLSRRLDYYIAPIQWLHLASASLEEHAGTLKKAIERDEEWTAHATAPTLARSLRYRPLSALAVPFSASLLAGVVLIGGVWWVYHHERRAQQAALDQQPEALGYIALTSAETGSADAPRRLRLNGSVVVFAPTTSYADVRARLNTGAEGTPPRIVDVSAHLDNRQVGGGQMFSFETDAIGDLVIACLSMPHPRLPGPYRVTDVYAATPQPTGNGIRIVFARSAASKVTREDGAPCQ